MTPRAIFTQKTPSIMRQLMEKFDLLDFQAAGILGNLGHECNGFTELHEKGQPAGRGGYGWAQWTGPRRVTFFNWCKAHNLDWTSDAGNLGYLIFELHNDPVTVSSLHKARTLEAATVAFERNFERAGVVNMKSRNKWAEIALDAFKKADGHAPTLSS